MNQKLDFEVLARLVERAKEGDYDAYSEIYIIFSKRVYYLALRLTKNEEDANDVMQETMLAVYNNLQNIENSRAIVSYINSVAYKQSMRVLQKRQIYVTENDDAYDILNIEDYDEEFIPEKYIEQQETHDCFAGIIDKLTEPLRAVVMLHYYDRYTISQIAEALGITESTTKTRLSRARVILKDLLETAQDNGDLDIGRKIDKNDKSDKNEKSDKNDKNDKDDKDDKDDKKSNKEKLGGFVLPVPVLTRILHAHADKVYTKEICTTIWKNIAEKLNFPAEAVARTSVLVAKAYTSSAPAAASSTLKTVLTLTTGSYVTTAIVAACITAAIGGGVFFYHRTREPYVETVYTIEETRHVEEIPNYNIYIGNQADYDIEPPVTRPTPPPTEQNSSSQPLEAVPYYVSLPSAASVEQGNLASDAPAVPPHAASYYLPHGETQDVNGNATEEEHELYEESADPTGATYEEPSTAPPAEDATEPYEAIEPPTVATSPPELSTEQPTEQVLPPEPPTEQPTEPELPTELPTEQPTEQVLPPEPPTEPSAPQPPRAR